MAAMNLTATCAINTMATGQKHTNGLRLTATCTKTWMPAKAKKFKPNQLEENSCQLHHAPIWLGQLSQDLRSLPISQVVMLIALVMPVSRWSKTTHSVILQPKLRLYFDRQMLWDATSIGACAILRPTVTTHVRTHLENSVKPIFINHLQWLLSCLPTWSPMRAQGTNQHLAIHIAFSRLQVSFC